MKKQSFVNELSKGEKVEDIFFVKYIAEASGKDGRKYLNAVLSDKSGDLEAENGAEQKRSSRMLLVETLSLYLAKLMFIKTEFK